MIQTEQHPVFQLRGSMLAITILELEHNNLELLDHQLAAKVEKAPQFFGNTPLILTLEKLSPEERQVDLAALLMLCYKHGLCTLGIRASHPEHLEAARRLHIPIIPPTTGASGQSKKAALPDEEPAAAVTAVTPPQTILNRPARIVTQPVRGGQQIYTQGDLIVLAAVSPGAELLADGNIHVYAPLRGRALAGARGDANAHIFCKQLAAEMLSIAGCYKVAEDLRRQPLWGASAHITLTGDVLNINPL